MTHVVTESKANAAAGPSGNGKVGAVLVVGGGIAGIETSLNLANSGLKVYLVERTPSIGGTMARLDKTFPTNDCSMCILSPKLVECGRHLNIENMTSSELIELTGEAGHFKATIRRRLGCIDPAKCKGCGDCATACPVEWEDEFNAGLSARKAVYRPFPQAYPNVFTIDKRERGPCHGACPGGINIQGFVALIGAGKYKEALGVIRDSMAFPSVCGRVCHHPCEDVCKRGLYDEPLSIMALKRFVADKCGGEELHLPAREAAKPCKVAVIGAGPAGLSAAFELARKGYPVEVFEALPEPGGMLAVGIPDYRLPRDVLRREIERIEKMGVTIHCGRRLGEDFTTEGLLKDGFKAVLLAIGAHEPIRLGIAGEDLAGVIDCVRFLRDVNLGNKVEVGRKVVVIGGGNAAIDAARGALRFGGPQVTILYRRTRKEMPANADEIEEAVKEGIRIEYLAAPCEIRGEGGRARSLLCQRMKLGAPDSSGRRRPVPIDGSEFEIAADTIIPAISQKTGGELGGVRVNKWGAIETKKDSAETSAPGVFACGDAVDGPGTVIESIAAGKRAALDIDASLSGKAASPAAAGAGGDKAGAVPADPTRPFPDYVERRKRATVPRIEVDRRFNNFNEVESALSEKDAVAEAKRCLACGLCSECMQCVAVCEAKAIDHSLREKVVEVDIGAVILAPGFREFDAARKVALGYARSGNIVSSMEFERILSASGPYGGHVVRPSDGGTVRKLAFIQCVGSRDPKCGREYCSSVCCMYAVKEAVIAREHDRNVHPTVFFMDIRAHGKDFDKYVERAQNDYGVVFKRSRVYSVEEGAGGQVMVTCETEDGTFAKESFDMAVLSVGLEPGADFASLAERLGIERDAHGFFKSGELTPLDASRPGIYLCGASSGPKDIPETVVQAGGAAARAGMLLGEQRGTLTKVKTYPKERDVSFQGARIGVFVCRCGINIGGVVNVPSVVEYARTLPNVVYAEENIYTCSQDTQEKMKQLIEEKDLNRIVVASCTPRTHEPLFQETIREAGLNPHLFEMANIRDQCSWVHMDRKDAATDKSMDLLRMAVAKVRSAAPLRTILLDVTRSALVVGGGLAGMTAALSLAGQGFDVCLVEKEKELGGMLRRLTGSLNGLPAEAASAQADSSAPDYLRDVVTAVRANPRIAVRTNSRIKAVNGFIGNYESTIETTVRGKATEEKVKHGAAVVATGGVESQPEEYGYGRSPRVITQLELERKLGGKNPRPPARVVMIQCVGSREPGHMYCSRICCTQAVRNAIRIKNANPDSEVVILYRDMRTYGMRERDYGRARELGVQFVRFALASKPTVRVAKGGRVTVRVRDTLLGEELEMPADWLVLSSRIDPAADNPATGELFKVALNDEKFFLEAHVKLRPVDFATEGLFVCGLAHYPKDVGETIAQALAAAGRAATVLSRDKIESEAKISFVHEGRCSGCGACVGVCPYHAIAMDEHKRVAKVNEGVCKGCGACAATCRAGAVDVKGYRDEQLLMTVEEL